MITGKLSIVLLRAVATLMLVLNLSIGLQSAIASEQQVTFKHQVEMESSKRPGDTYQTHTGRVVVNASLDAAAELLKNTEALIEWVYSCTSSDTVDYRAENDVTLYMVFEAPMLLDDRDGYITFFGQLDPDAGQLKATLKSDDDYEIHEEKIRLSRVKGYFQFDRLVDNSLGATFELHIDPKLRPLFAANGNTKKVVERTLENVKARLENAAKNNSGE